METEQNMHKQSQSQKGNQGKNKFPQKKGKWRGKLSEIIGDRNGSTKEEILSNYITKEEITQNNLKF